MHLHKNDAKNSEDDDNHGGAPEVKTVANLASGSHFYNEMNRAPTSNKDSKFALETKRAVNFGSSRSYQLDDQVARQKEIDNIIAF